MISPTQLQPDGAIQSHEEEAPGVPDVDVAGATDLGLQRSRNEDNYVIGELNRWLQLTESSLEIAPAARWRSRNQALLMAVADGAGGHSDGQFASALALETLVSYAAHAMPWLTGGAGADEVIMRETLVAALNRCQQKLVNHAQSDARKPATTLTAAYIAWPSMYVFHVGDSRCYLLRGTDLIQITRDMTLAQELVDQGFDPAEIHPRFQHVLSAAIGGSGRPVAPEVQRVWLRAGDTVLLCSDGLTGQVDRACIVDVLRGAANARAAARSLVERANAAGGNDNVTAVVARYDEL